MDRIEFLLENMQEKKEPTASIINKHLEFLFENRSERSQN